MRRSLILLAACLCAAHGNLHAEDWIATLQTAGRYVAVETRDSLVFLASEWGLEIFSIADPRNPLRLSSMPTAGTADNLEIDDRYVYLADQSNGLLVIDCQDPYAPQVVRTLSHNLTDLTTGEVAIRDLLRRDTILYVASPNSAIGPGIHIFDITDPPNTYLAYQYEFSASEDTLTIPYAFAVQDSTLYVVDLFGLWTSDITDPGYPVRLGVHRRAGGGYWVPDAVVATTQQLRMYDGLLRTYDVTNPSLPMFVGSQLLVDTADSPAVALQVQDFALLDSTLLMPTYATGIKLAALPPDAADPISIAGRFATPGLASAITVADSIVVIADGDGGIETAAAEHIGLDSLGYFPTRFSVASLLRVGRFVFARTGSIAIVFDIADPRFPAVADSLAFLNVWRMQASSGLLYATDQDAVNATTFFEIFDLSDTLNPISITRYEMPTRHGRSFQVQGGFSYHADSKFTILDVSDPSSIHVEGQVPGFFPDDGTVVVSGNRAYASYGPLLYVIDIGNPSSPTVIDPAGVPLPVHEAIIEDTLLYGVSSLGLQILSIADDSDIYLVGAVGVSGALRLQKHDNKVFLAPVRSDVAVYDVSDPSQPMLDTHWRTPGEAVGLTIDDSILCVGDLFGLTLVRHASSVNVEDDAPSIVPECLWVGQNYPNPFNMTTSIPIRLSLPTQITLSVHNLLGQRVAVQNLGFLPRGNHTIHWSAASLGEFAPPSGVYFYRVEGSGTVVTRKLLLLK